VTQKKRMNQTKLADTLYSQIIRAQGGCIAEGYRRPENLNPIPRPFINCSGNLQCAHVVSRTYRAVRWRTDYPAGAVPLCGAHHVWFTHHPLEWIEYMGEYYDAVRKLALTTPPENAGDALARLRGMEVPVD
jgi:hypothetical protein